MESIQCADYCILVAEQTVFGLYNLQMVYELVTLLGKPCGVVINKVDGEYPPLNGFLEEHGISVLCRIPYSEHLAALGANADIATRCDEDMAVLFRGLLRDIAKKVCA
jgi:MinD superfamily P-loop ATPase containing an inserted ferredoxin domain